MRGDDELTRGEPSDENPQAQPPWPPPPPRPPVPPSQDFDEGPRGESGAAAGEPPLEGSTGSPVPPPPPGPAAQPASPPPGGGWEPAPPPPPDEPRLPWEDRARHGTLPAFFRTIGLLIGSPGKAFAMARKKGDYASPIFFAIIVGWLGYIAARFWTDVMHWSFFFFFLPEPLKDQLGDVSASTVGGSIIGSVLGFVFVPLGVIVSLFVGSAVLHLFLMLFDGLRHSRAGFEGTVRTLAYSSVASLGYFIPFVGTLIIIVWSIALETIGAASLHDTSKGRAFAAIVVPAVLCCTCVFLFVATIVTIVGMVLAGTGV